MYFLQVTLHYVIFKKLTSFIKTRFINKTRKAKKNILIYQIGSICYFFFETNLQIISKIFIIFANVSIRLFLKLKFCLTFSTAWWTTPNLDDRHCGLANLIKKFF